MRKIFLYKGIEARWRVIKPEPPFQTKETGGIQISSGILRIGNRDIGPNGCNQLSTVLVASFREFARRDFGKQLKLNRKILLTTSC